jgi:hypothetical protein
MVRDISSLTYYSSQFYRAAHNREWLQKIATSRSTASMSANFARHGRARISQPVQKLLCVRELLANELAYFQRMLLLESLASQML